MARVYLYAGRNEDALIMARKLVEIQSKMVSFCGLQFINGEWETRVRIGCSRQKYYSDWRNRNVVKYLRIILHRNWTTAYWLRRIQVC